MANKTRQTPEVLTCHYCGAVKNEISFVIGAARKADWCMVYGTGFMTCPDCYDVAMAEGVARVDRQFTEYNKQATSAANIVYTNLGAQTEMTLPCTGKLF